MEVKPTPSYTITVNQKDFNLICACIAQCAEIKGVSVKPNEASELNVRLLKSVEHWIAEQRQYLDTRIAKAAENLMSFQQAGDRGVKALRQGARCPQCGHLWGAYEDDCHCNGGTCHNREVCEGTRASNLPNQQEDQ